MLPVTSSAGAADPGQPADAQARTTSTHRKAGSSAVRLSRRTRTGKNHKGQCGLVDPTRPSPSLLQQGCVLRSTFRRAQAGGASACERWAQGAARRAAGVCWVAAPLALPSHSRGLAIMSSSDTTVRARADPDRRREAGGASACERWAQGAARRAAAALVPLPAAARLLLAAPLALLITLERCALMVVRDLVTGVVQTASDYALKPALALVFNAVVRPPLVFAANVSRAVRAALRPLAAAATDAVEPAAALLRSLRLVTVRYDRAGGTRLRPDTDA
ncbi:hypothetical protein evm_013070 [Chilo suppressalis]|nr:hypothetical protein evm_013070 [Chilo suppressalis]